MSVYYEICLQPSNSSSTGKKAKVINGYIIYSAESRKEVQDSNPGRSFGEISRIVGLQVCRWHCIAWRAGHDGKTGFNI